MKGLYGLRSALSLAVGVGSAITGSYLVSRVKEKQEVESRLDRLEAVVEKLATTVSEAQEAPAKSAPRRTSRSAPKSAAKSTTKSTAKSDKETKK